MTQPMLGSDGLSPEAAGPPDRTLQEILKREIREIVAKGWMFVSYETGVSSPGDFIEVFEGRGERLL